MADFVIRLSAGDREVLGSETGLMREWLVTNGLGGYASGTLAGVVTRRYHGYLIAALPAPYGRMMMLNDLVERVELPNGSFVQLGGEERAGAQLKMHGAEFLNEFRLEGGVPIWRYDLDSIAIEKKLVLPHEQNSVYIHYRLISGDGSVRITLRPLLHFRPHESPVSVELDPSYVLTVAEERYEVSLGNLPPLRILLYGSKAALTIDKIRVQEISYRIEERRGYPARGDLWSPGYLQADLRKDSDLTLVASTEALETIRALSP